MPLLASISVLAANCQDMFAVTLADLKRLRQGPEFYPGLAPPFILEIHTLFLV
jgi:hypothetical protein